MGWGGGGSGEAGGWFVDGLSYIGGFPWGWQLGVPRVGQIGTYDYEGSKVSEVIRFW